MNPNTPQPSREEIEAKLTALLLGELPAEEAALLRWTIAQDTGLSQLHKRLKTTIDFVREVAAHPSETATLPAAPLKLSAAKREKLLAHFKLIAPRAVGPNVVAPAKRRVMPSIYTLAATVALMAVLAALMLPALSKAKNKAQRVTALNQAKMQELNAQLYSDQKALAANTPMESSPAPAIVPPAGTEQRLESVEDFFKNGDPTVSDGNRAQSSPQTVAAPPSAPEVAPPPSQIALPRSGSHADSSRLAEEPVTATFTIATPQHALDGDGPPNPPVAKAPRQLNSDEYVFSPTPSHALDSGQWVRKRDGAVVSQAEVDAWRAAQTRAAGIGGAIAGQANDTFANSPIFQKRYAFIQQPAATVSGGNLSINGWTSQNGYRMQKDQISYAGDDADKLPISGSSSVSGYVERHYIVAANEPVVIAAKKTPSSEKLQNSRDGSVVGFVNTFAGEKSGDHFYRLIEGSRAGGTSQSLTVDSLGAIAQKSKVAVKDEDRPILKTPSSAPVPQPEIQTSDNAFSTFSLNVSDVSFKLAAASLENGVLPEAASIRSEEFINAFDYRDPEPAVGVPVAFVAERARDPFVHNRDLLRFSIKTSAAGREAGRPLNLVLLLDNSGSMERADRVSIIHEALKVLAAQLQPQDTLSIVTFARTARLWVDGASGAAAAAAVSRVSDLVPEGGTNLEEAMKLAYATARRHYLTNGGNRVVVLTDGAANLGNVDPEALKQMVEAQRRQGIALDCFGIGWEGYNDDLLEVLSSNGDGRYAFINTPEEAGTEFAAKLAGALHVAAEDVKVQVEFNPRRVTSYRQIGYATHQLTKEQFRDNTVAAAALAAREAGNALYTVEVNPQGEGPLATVHVRFRVPGTTDVSEHEWDVPFDGAAPALEQSSPAMRLAATASAFSEWLASSPYAQEVTPEQLLKYLSGVPAIYGADARPKQLETMIREAKSLSGK